MSNEGAALVAAPRGYMPRAKASDWRTPAVVVELLEAMWDGKVELDPCASPDRAHWFARRNIHPPTGDGLKQPWVAASAFVNPPFDELAAWAARCTEQAKGRPDAEVVLLMPARTDTRYWHEHVGTAQAVCLWRGRLMFVGAPSVAPFPVAFAYWGKKPWRFQRAFGERGMVVVP